MEHPVEKITTKSGTEIFVIECRSFDSLVISRVYVIPSLSTVIDAGGANENSCRDIFDGFQSIQEDHKVNISVHDIKRILFTHGHMDHTGGARVFSNPSIERFLHVNDYMLTCSDSLAFKQYTERLEELFDMTGIPEFTRRIYRQVLHKMWPDEQNYLPIKYFPEEGDMIGDISVIAAPSHTSGHLYYQLENVLFGGDNFGTENHVMVMPAMLSSDLGFENYRKTIERVYESYYSGNINIIAPGHGETIYNIADHRNNAITNQKKRFKKMFNFLGVGSSRDSFEDRVKLITPNMLNRVNEVLNNHFVEINDYSAFISWIEVTTRIEYLIEQHVAQESRRPVEETVSEMPKKLLFSA